MSAIICPCVTPATSDPHVYREQVERISFAPRIQIDLMDGLFAPNKNLNPIQVWWPDQVLADIHLMYAHPHEQLETLISLSPHLILLHAEAEGDVASYIEHIQKFGLRAGVALLADTPVAMTHGMIEVADHVMLFSGNLGEFGGTADLALLEKVAQIRAINPAVEIGWDGGATLETVRHLSDGGIDVINVGGAIQRASDPRRAYEELRSVVESQDGEAERA
ncbi:MAG: hypothetical protein WAU02_00090 [Candidatus Saccharimonadales bacterium]